MSDSESDDEILPIARVTRLITGCEEFVETRVNSLQKQQNENNVSTTKRLKVLEERDTERRIWIQPIEDLQHDTENFKMRVTQLEQQIQAIPKCRCSQLFQAITKVGPMVLQGEVEIHYGQADQGVSQIQVVPTDQLLTATPIEPQSSKTSLPLQTAPMDMEDTTSLGEEQESTVPFQPLENPSTSNQCLPLGLGLGVKRSHTAKCYEHFDELPERLQNKLRRFYSPRSSMASNEKLSDLQRAQVECYLEKGKNKKQSPSEIATECMVNAVEEKLWPENFIPKGVTTTFRKYLNQRIKNKMARDALRQAEKKQKIKFSAYEGRE